MSYTIKDRAVYWGSEEALTLLANADQDTFKILSQRYAKDKHRVYFDGEMLWDAKPEFFVLLGNGYARDNKRVFWFERRAMTSKRLKGLDVASLEYLSGNYFRDQYRVYWEASATSFYVVEGADSASFKVTAENYGEDKQLQFSGDECIEYNTQSGAVIMLNDVYSIADGKVYADGKWISDADSASLQLFSDEIAIDQQSVFFRGQKIPSLSPNYLHLIEKPPSDDMDDSLYFYLADNLNAYCVIDQGPIVISLSGVNVTALKVLNTFYVKDDQFVYRIGKKIRTADAKTFEVIGASMAYSRDHKSVFFYGKKITGADPDNFKLLKGTYYSQDNRQIYWRGNVMKDADFNSFTVDDHDSGYYATDARHHYRQGKIARD